MIPSYGQAAFVAAAVASALAAVGVDARGRRRRRSLAGRLGRDRARACSRRTRSGALKLVEQADNAGLAGARNRGFREARAPLVLLLDADDALLPHGPAALRRGARGRSRGRVRLRLRWRASASSARTCSAPSPGIRRSSGTATTCPSRARSCAARPGSSSAATPPRACSSSAGRISTSGCAWRRPGSTARTCGASSAPIACTASSMSTVTNSHAGALMAFLRERHPGSDGRAMTPDELLTHLEAELARCRDERDRLSAELEVTLAERDAARCDSARSERSCSRCRPTRRGRARARPALRRVRLARRARRAGS